MPKETYINPENTPAKPEEKEVEIPRKFSDATLKKMEKQPETWDKQLNARSEKAGDQKFNEKVRELWKELAVHGTVKLDKEGRPFVDKTSDVDVNVALGILKMAGIDTSNIEFVNPGSYRKNKINIDTGNQDGFEVLEDDEGSLTIFGDHHSDASGRDTSASKIFYETMISMNMIEKTPALDRLVEFVTRVDNKTFPDAKKYYPESYHTVLGLYRYMDFPALLKYFASGRSANELLSGQDLASYNLLWAKKKKKETDPTKFAGPAATQKNNIEKSLSRLKEIEAKGLIIDSARYGRIVVDIGKQIPSGIDAAEYYGCDTYINWSPDKKGFFITSPEKGITDTFSQGINKRGGMYFKPIADRAPLTLKLGEVLDKMTDGQLNPTGELKVFLDKEKAEGYIKEMTETRKTAPTEIPPTQEGNDLNSKLDDLLNELMMKGEDEISTKDYNEKTDAIEEARKIAKTDIPSAITILEGHGLISAEEADKYLGKKDLAGETKIQPEERSEKAVAVEGKFLGREFEEFALFNLKPSMLGSDAFTEIYFETESGNQYKISKTEDSEYILSDTRSNKTTVLNEEDLENGILHAGQPFNYGKGSRTTAITKITAVNTNRIYSPDYLKNITDGVTSDVRGKFSKKISSQEKSPESLVADMDRDIDKEPEVSEIDKIEASIKEITDKLRDRIMPWKESEELRKELKERKDELAKIKTSVEIKDTDLSWEEIEKKRQEAIATGRVPGVTERGLSYWDQIKKDKLTAEREAEVEENNKRIAAQKEAAEKIRTAEREAREAEEKRKEAERNAESDKWLKKEDGEVKEPPPTPPAEGGAPETTKESGEEYSLDEILDNKHLAKDTGRIPGVTEKGYSFWDKVENEYRNKYPDKYEEMRSDYYKKHPGKDELPRPKKRSFWSRIFGG